MDYLIFITEWLTEAVDKVNLNFSITLSVPLRLAALLLATDMTMKFI